MSLNTVAAPSTLRRIRPPEAPVLSLVVLLAEALRARGVAYCQWKGHGKHDRWGTGAGDIDLLVDRLAVAEFTTVLADLGFKSAHPGLGRAPAGVLHYHGLDQSTGRLVHVHAYTRLVIGKAWRTQYHLPIEQTLLASRVPRPVFPTPTPELERMVLLLHLILRTSVRDLVRRSPPAWLYAALAELERLEEEARPERLAAALGPHLPAIDAAFLDACRRALRPPPDGTAWQRLLLRRELERRLSTSAIRPSPWTLLRQVARHWLGPANHQGHRLAAGGAVVALLGGDGSGKSTCARVLVEWLAPALAVTRIHVGRPPRALTTLIVGGLLKLARRLGTAGQVIGLVPHLELLRFLCTARDRARACARAWRFAARGGVAICERYPVRENRALAGPSDEQGFGLDLSSRLAVLLRRWEHRYYDRLPLPDLVFVLRLEPEAAVRRKPEEPAAYVRARARLMWDADWSRLGRAARVVDAALPFQQVLEHIKAEMWRTL
jgi:thymidylate kinase